MLERDGRLNRRPLQDVTPLVRVRFVVVRVEQLVGVDYEVAHQGVVDGRLRLGAPGGERLGVAGIGAHQVDLRQVAELYALDLFEFAADDEMQELSVGHGQVISQNDSIGEGDMRDALQDQWGETWRGADEARLRPFRGG